MPSIANANKVPSINAIFGGVADPVPDSLFNYKFDFTDSGMSYFPSTPTGKNDMDYFRSAPACLDTIGGFFNGVDRYNTGDAYTEIVGTESAFSLSFWIDTSSQAGGLQRLVVTGSSTAGGNGFYVAMTPTGTIRFRSDGIINNATTAINDGTPHFVLITYDGTTLKIYIDNVEDLSVITSMNTFNPSSLYMGSTAGGSSGFFTGVLDDIRYYDRVLATDERTALYNYRCDFNPSQITTSAWFDAQDQTTITESLGAVSQLDDKSGNSLNIEQSNLTLQPTTGIENINGLNSLGYDSTNDELSYPLATTLLTQGSNIHAFFVGDIPSTGGSFGSILSHTSGGLGIVISRRSTIDTLYLRVDSDTTFNSAINSSSGFFDNSPHIFYANVLSDNTRSIWRDGVVDNQSTWTGNTFATNSSIGDVGLCSDEMGELIVINGVLTSSDRQKIEGYLAWKWGLVADLPSGHPYKNTPPKE